MYLHQLPLLESHFPLLGVQHLSIEPRLAIYGVSYSLGIAVQPLLGCIRYMHVEILVRRHRGACFERGGCCVDNEAEEEFLRRELEGGQYAPIEYLDGFVEVVGPCFW